MVDKANINMYKDGKRLVVVFENCNEDIEKLISGLLSGIACNELKGVHPIEKETLPIPKIAEKSKFKMDEKYNENIVTNEDIPSCLKILTDFPKFISAFYLWNEMKNDDQKKEQLKLQLCAYIHSRMASINPETFSNAELLYIVKVGAESVFKTKIMQFMKYYGIPTIDDLIKSGRPVLNEVYRRCTATK